MAKLATTTTVAPLMILAEMEFVKEPSLAPPLIRAKLRFAAPMFLVILPTNPTKLRVKTKTLAPWNPFVERVFAPE